ncbi:MAG TPA: SsrA-binding protein SmpB [Dehalococcoidia bacterium]|nr:SsrA-binding protein SmpB [Dehalococcoidia bacterium]
MAEKVIAVNRKALHDYHIMETVEAGLVLSGTEIKSIREGRVSLREAFARPDGDELWLLGAHIAQYPAAGRFNHEPTRKRKLLLHKGEMRELSAALGEKGLTLIPLRLYLKNGRAKLELALARGKRSHDKREAIAKREAERQMQRALRR